MEKPNIKKFVKNILLAMIPLLLVVACILVPLSVRSNRLYRVSRDFVTGVYRKNQNLYQSSCHPNIIDEDEEGNIFSVGAIAVKDVSLVSIRFCEKEDLTVFQESFINEHGISAKKFAIVNVDVYTHSGPNPDRIELILCKYEGQWKVVF